MTTSDTGTRWRRRATCALATTAMITGGGVLLAAPSLADTTTVYVSPDGDNHDGCGKSLSNQCATIQYGVDQATAGQTVQVAKGTYNEAVTIDKPITLSGAGSSTTAIDGLGLTLPNGLVNIAQPGGDVTVSGFTITNPGPSGNGEPFALTVNDSSAADSITVDHNNFPGDPADPAASAAAPIGVDSADTAATQVITNNDFSGLFQGVLLEGSSGPVDVSSNSFHDLVASDTGKGDGSTYPAEGVYFLGDKGVAATQQNVSDNTFENYGGIGIAYRAGYDLGGCATTTCLGSVSGSVTDNTFALTAAADGSLPAAALRLQSKYEGDTLDLTIGGNHGTVVAPTQPIIEQPADGSTITLTSNGTPNTIVTDPAPTVSVSTPSALTTDEDPVAFIGTATNPSAEDLQNVRYDVRITGTSGLTAAQLKLEYSTDDGDTYQAVPLSGAASSGDAITGYFGPQSGFTFGAGKQLSTKFRVSIPDVSAPAGTLTSTVSLDQVSSGEGNPAINTLASSTSTTTVTANSAPVASNITVGTIVNTPVSFTLPGTDADGDALTYKTFTVSHGTLSGTAPDLTFTPDEDYTGTTTFAYSVTDDKAGSDIGTVTVTVSPKATTTLSLATSPANPTTADAVTVTANVTGSAGTVSGGSVTVTVNGESYTGDVSNGVATIPVGKLPAGTFPISGTFSGTAAANSSTATGSVTVTTVASSLTVTRTPAATTTANASTALNVTVTAPGVNPDGGLVTITEGTRTVGTSATVTNGKATVTLPNLSAGTRTFVVHYAGNATTAASTSTVTIVITKVGSSLTVTRTPATTTTKTKSTALNVTVAAPGVNPDGGLVTITEGTRTVGTSATVTNGKATVTLPNLSAGTRTFVVHYAGNAKTAASTKTVTIVVAKA